LKLALAGDVMLTEFLSLNASMISFEALTEVKVQFEVFCVVMLYIVGVGYQHFRGPSAG
jgi:hypothetical protein